MLRHISACAVFCLLVGAPLFAETVRTTTRLNLRAGPSTESGRLELLPAGATLSVLARQDVWMRVRRGDTEGWVHSHYVEAPVGDPNVETDAARALRQAELARDVALLRVEQLEADLEALRAELAARDERLAELAADAATPAVTPQRGEQVAPAEPLPLPRPAVPEGTQVALRGDGIGVALATVTEPLAVERAFSGGVIEGYGEGVVSAVRQWAEAWSRQDVRSYLTAYGEEFSPADGSAREDWEAQRQARLSRPAFIRVDLADLIVRQLATDHAVVEFEQRYRSDLLSDVVHKRLELVRTKSGWKIVREAVD